MNFNVTKLINKQVLISLLAVSVFSIVICKGDQFIVNL